MQKTMPEKASRYMARKFERTFANGCEFWTGEDGMLMSLVIMRRSDWAEALQHNFKHRLAREGFTKSRGRERFAYRAPVEDGQWSGIRKIWCVQDEPTPFPVIEYELEKPW